MISTRLVVFVVSIIAQIHFVLTLNNRNILGILRNKSPTDAPPIQDEILSQLIHSSPYIHDFQQLADGIYLAKLNERLSDWTAISSDLTSSGVSIASEFQTTLPSITITFTTTFDEMTSSDDTMITSGMNNNSSIITTTSYNTMATTNSNITLDNRNTTATPALESEKNLPLILGLTLGLGIPICLAITGSLIYYFKIYRPRHSQIGILNI